MQGWLQAVRTGKWHSLIQLLYLILWSPRNYDATLREQHLCLLEVCFILVLFFSWKMDVSFWEFFCSVAASLAENLVKVWALQNSPYVGEVGFFFSFEKLGWILSVYEAFSLQISISSLLNVCVSCKLYPESLKFWNIQITVKLYSEFFFLTNLSIVLGKAARLQWNEWTKCRVV